MTSDKLNQFPQHVAIIMDGNGRWAKKHHLPRLEGHKKGAENARDVVGKFIQHGIPYLTLFVFSTENWDRPSFEVNGLFKLLIEKLDEGIQIARRENIKVRHVGALDGLPQIVKDKIDEAMRLTRDNTAMTLNLAFNYGARDEIVRAVRQLIQSGIPAHLLDENTISEHLFTSGIPDPDLIIRTGGEMRLSNFMLWQAAYAEIYCTPALWPDFNDNEIAKALAAYGQRQRRFGKVSAD